MKTQFASTGIIFLCLISILQANQIKRDFKIGDCVAESFEDSGTIIKNIVSSGRNELVVIPYITAKDVPPGFDDEEAYTTKCLNSKIITIAKSATPNDIIEKISMLSSDSTNSVTFKNLDYITDYDVILSYSQKSPNPNTEYLVKTFKYDTCFGPPKKVTNLKFDDSQNDEILITWNKPSTDGPSVCYYDITMSYSGSDQKKFETTSLSLRYTGDLRRKITIFVEAINDRQSFDGKQCNDIRESCRTQASGYESVTYNPPATTKPTTVRSTTSEAASLFNINFSLILSLIYSLVLLV